MVISTYVKPLVIWLKDFNLILVINIIKDLLLVIVIVISICIKPLVV